MNLHDFALRLEQNIEIFRALFNGVTDEQALWRPEPGKWSMLEVVNHLYDEEREDFRARLDHILHKEGEAPGIDPEGWVQSREYQKRDFRESIENFIAERRQSLRWLETLESPDWERAYVHPVFTLKAGSVLAAWVAHDYLHVRQITRLHYGYLQMLAAPYTVEYAGDW